MLSNSALSQAHLLQEAIIGGSGIRCKAGDCNGKICKGAAEPARARMAGDVLQLRRAEERLETHPPASHHASDVLALREVPRAAAIRCVHGAGQTSGKPHQDAHSDSQSDLLPRSTDKATRLHAFFLAQVGTA